MTCNIDEFQKLYARFKKDILYHMIPFMRYSGKGKTIRIAISEGGAVRGQVEGEGTDCKEVGENLWGDEYVLLLGYGSGYRT